MKPLALAALSLMAVSLAACNDDAQVANENLTKAADNFEVPRRIVFVNGFTDKYLLEIQGYCSQSQESRKFTVICKTPEGYKKHFLGLSDNVTYFTEQLNPVRVSVDFYRVTFKPTEIIPDIRLQVGK